MNIYSPFRNTKAEEFVCQVRGYQRLIDYANRKKINIPLTLLLANTKAVSVICSLGNPARKAYIQSVLTG